MTKQFLRLLLVVGFLLNVQSLFAVCGTTDYSGGSGRLYDMTTFVLVLCYYTSLIVETLAGILSSYRYDTGAAPSPGSYGSIVLYVGTASPSPLPSCISYYGYVGD